jgi:diadenylate cyclase
MAARSIRHIHQPSPISHDADQTSAMTWITTFLRRPAIGWWDLVDILVVSVLIYELLKLIRGTRAVQMALGGGVLVALFYGSRWAHLETVNWLVRNLVGYLVFAVIVLFQSDIRRALAHLGRAPFFRYFAKPESAEESIEELVVAASMLSAQHIGAIIAIERQIGLRNYIEGGIPLDAVLTYDLLLSVFQPSSPLHDGAVIVQDDRVAAAACFLPLTVNPKLSKELGSRHRAALGLTEENDSVAIVISEENGVISVVADGQIERDLNADALRASLRSLVLQRRAPRPKRESRLSYT